MAKQMTHVSTGGGASLEFPRRPRAAGRRGPERPERGTPFKVVLLRHGESTWNRENRFTGWTDVDLVRAWAGRGAPAGQLLKAEGYTFDMASRRCSTAPFAPCGWRSTRLDLMWIPMHHSWRLNERHYGALQG